MLRICYYLGIKEKVLGPCLHALGSRSRSPYLLTYMHTCNAYRVCVCLSVCRLSSLSLCLARSVCYISLAYIPASFHSFLITSLLLHLSLSLRSLNNIHLYRKGSLATLEVCFLGMTSELLFKDKRSLWARHYFSFIGTPKDWLRNTSTVSTSGEIDRPQGSVNCMNFER
jgi:hypothetical protein